MRGGREDKWRDCVFMFFLCFSVVTHLTEITPGSICDNFEHFCENQSTLESMVSEL